MGSVIIGSARIDERGRASGGAAGDQKQHTAPDYAGEVSQQEFYVHEKGWYVLRPKDAEIAARIAANMVTACNNPNVGYDQGNRLGVIRYGVASTVKTESDCSSLVRACIKEATGYDPGDFTTSGEAAALEASGLFEKRKSYTPGMKLYAGDVLVTKTKGHTVVVTEGNARTASASKPAAYPKWVKSGNDWYYRIAEGKNAHGWRSINRHRYYFNSQGQMLTGWQQIGEDWYYFQPEEGKGASLAGALYVSEKDGKQHILTE